MNKKVNGDELLLAIGELPCELLRLSPPINTRRRAIRNLSVAAAIALFVGVLSPFVIGSLSKQGFGNVANDAGPPPKDMVEVGGESGSTSDEEGSLGYENSLSAICSSYLKIDSSGRVLVSESALSGGRIYLFGNLAYVALDKPEDAELDLYIRSYGVAIAPSHETYDSVVYAIPVNDVTELDAYDKSGNPIFTLRLLSDGKYAEFEVIYEGR